MPYVTIKMLAGRTDEQKKSMIEKVTDVVAETAKVPAEKVVVFIDEMTPNHYAIAGKRPIDNE